jgi:hypothetical protein
MTRDKVRMRESNAAHGLQGKTIPSPFQTDAAPRRLGRLGSASPFAALLFQAPGGVEGAVLPRLNHSHQAPRNGIPR